MERASLVQNHPRYRANVNKPLFVLYDPRLPRQEGWHNCGAESQAFLPKYFATVNASIKEFIVKAPRKLGPINFLAVMFSSTLLFHYILLLPCLKSNSCTLNALITSFFFVFVIYGL